MTIDAKSLEIVKAPAEILIKKCEEIKFSENIKEVSNRMLELMKIHKGIGLASNQVGLNWRMFVVYIPETMKHPKVCINPIIESGCIPEYSEEACLSEPGIFKIIKRNKYIVIRYTDINGKQIKEPMRGLEARCAQHEIDHLDGILISSK